MPITDSGALPEGLDDTALEAALFPPPPQSRVRRPEPDWGDVHRELQRHKGVTLQLLWLEYRAAHPNGYQYSWFCERYKAWRGQLDVVMRQVYRAGEKAFVDYAGPKLPVVDRGTGEVRDDPADGPPIHRRRIPLVRLLRWRPTTSRQQVKLTVAILPASTTVAFSLGLG